MYYLMTGKNKTRKDEFKISLIEGGTRPALSIPVASIIENLK